MRSFLATREREQRARAGAAREALEAALPELTATLVRLGARRVWLFGSLAWGRADQSSDIDLATEGLPAAAHLRAQGELLLLAPGRVDLVRLEDAPETLATRIRDQGRILRG